MPVPGCPTVPPRPRRHRHRPPSRENPALSGVTPVKADANDAIGLAAALRGHDVAISSVHFTASDPRKLIEAVQTAGAGRYLVVGGAGSLEVAPGVKLIEMLEFPAIYKAEAAAGGVFLDLLRKETRLDWTFLSPSALFVPGERTGKFRLGGDQLLSNEKRQQHIVRGLRHCHGRRDRKAGTFAQALHGRRRSRCGACSLDAQPSRSDRGNGQHRELRMSYAAASSHSTAKDFFIASRRRDRLRRGAAPAVHAMRSGAPGRTA